MILSLLVHGLVALALVPLGRRMGRRVFLVAAAAPAAAFLWLLSVGHRVLAGEVVWQRVKWAPSLALDLTLRIDGFGWLMGAVVSGVGVLVMLYAHRYFSPRSDLGGFAATLTGFAGAMLGLVTADNLLALFVFWELTSITSYLLIGFDDRSAAARSAALQALLVTGVGGLAMMAGIVLVGEAASYSLAELGEVTLAGPAVSAGAALILAGAFTKSAQAPFHFWLPGAMAAPTPVSAYLHSATMVKAGVYLVARLAPVLAPQLEWWRPVVVGVGAVTMVLGGWRALSQTDLKLLLAYGTVSQLGFLMLLFGVGDPVTTFAGTAMLLAHTLFKAALFMVVGIVDHQAHTRDLRRLTGLGRRMPATVVVAALAAASMAGLPPLLGFVTKEAALEGLLEAAAPWAVAAVVVGSAFTVAYSARLLWGAFARKEGLIEPVGDEAAAPSGWFLAPAAVVAAAGLLWGVVPALADGWVGAAAESLAEHAGEHHLALWHGFTPALGLSAAAIAFGAVLHGRRGLVDGVASVTRRVPAAVSAYQWSLGALNRTADRVTGVVQPGSLPFYLAVILLAATLLPGWWLVKGIELPAEAVLAESPLQLLVALLVVAAAVGVASAPARLGAVLFLGAVGYGVAVLFVIQGAPDLALTQMLIETLTLAIFVLVLRYLPEHFDRVQWRVGRLLRMGVAGMLGTMVTLFALWSAGSRVSEGISAEFVQRSLPEGGGKNVVNVILTDFRALDTLGEITVLAVAALGVVALVRAPRPAAPDKEEG